MVCELDLQRAVIEQFGGSGAADLVHFVEPGPGEEDRGAAVLEIEAGLHGSEGDLAMAVGSNDHHGEVDEIEVVAIPQIGLDDPSFADQRMGGHVDHAGASRSFGRRTDCR